MVCRVARQVPQLCWVLNHCGEPTITGGASDPVWTDYISAVSSQPQVFCKLSGLVEYSQIQPAPGELDYYLPTLEVYGMLSAKTA